VTVAQRLRSPRLQSLLLLITFGCIAWVLSRQWAEVERAARSIEVKWGWIIAASVLVLLTYAMLIQSWRMLLHGWGGTLPYAKAAQIWTVANLGRYIPGKLWSVGALGVLAAREGVSGVAAAGAAVLGTVLNLGAGFGVAAIFGADLLDAISPGLSRVSIVAGILFVAAVALLPAVLPLLLRRVARWRGVAAAERQLSKRDLWTAAVINTGSWLGYGLAFACFSRGVTPVVSASAPLFIAVFAASYLVGFLVLFAPGGIGFREVALSALLVAGGAAGQGDAALLGATSRVWLTVLEILPGIIGLFCMSPQERGTLRSPQASSPPLH
jgi:uncharacterized membrane protein YbhN (UPF0104 family)